MEGLYAILLAEGLIFVASVLKKANKFKKETLVNIVKYL